MAKILVLDDDENFTKVVEKFLQLNTTHEVFAANTAKDAYVIAINEPIDLFLIDLKMEVIDGIQFIKMVRQIALYFDNPIIVVTGSDDIEYKNSALQVGASGLLNKPIDFNVLVSQIDTSLEDWRKEQDDI